VFIYMTPVTSFPGTKH